MKLVSTITAVTLAAAIIFASCNDEKKNDRTDMNTGPDTAVIAPPADPILNIGERVVVTRDQVPDTVLVVFEKKTPKATNVVYTKERVKPATEGDTTVIYYYYLDYDKDGYTYHAVYNEKAEPVKTKKDFKKIAGLPDAVSEVIAEYFPGATVEEIDKENDKDVVMYEVELKDGEKKWKVKFLSDGGIYKIK